MSPADWSRGERVAQGKGRIGMDRIPFIDTHVHFWDLKHPRLTYGWLAPDAVHPILGDIDGIKSTRYEAEHWWAEARFAAAEGVVHVQAAVGTPDPVEETRWLTAMHARTGYPNALIAHADLGEASIAGVLDAHQESALMRGVRDFSTEPRLAAGEISRAFDHGLRELASRGLVLDLDCEWPQMANAAKLATAHDDLVIVLEHIGFPRSRDPEYFEAWRDAMSVLAGAANVYCKISGLGMKDPLWTLDSIRPWVRQCVEAFGPARCVIGTNWPVDRLYSSYDAIADAYRACLSEYSDAEQQQILAGNARKVFKL
jgi:predicted TIM-barrel fold metal-dependent hydrolase